MDQMEAFQHMQAFGMDFVEACIACISGHRMTEDMAALAITTYWRRYAAIASFQESRGAAITLQASTRGWMMRSRYDLSALDNTQWNAVRGDARVQSEDDERFRSIQQLQAVWRGHLTRAFVDKLKWKSKSKLQRTFSWSNKSKRNKPAPREGIKNKTSSEILAAAGVDDVKANKPVRRSMSFDRFSRAFSKPKSDDSSKSPVATPPITQMRQLLFILLHRGKNGGLGLELDATNTVVNMVTGGAAAEQGYFREGDTIASVDGMPLRGRLLQDVMDRSKNSYSFDVWRLSRVEPDPPPSKVDKPVRRAFSFDRKRR